MPVYVWELPVRLAHWGLVIALVVLTITGSYMHILIWLRMAARLGDGLDALYS